MRLLRTKHLETNKIAVIPAAGYVNNENQSQLALNQLKWIEQEENLVLQTKENGGEHSIKIGSSTYKIDGYDSLTRTVYEINGCFW